MRGVNMESKGKLEERKWAEMRRGKVRENGWKGSTGNYGLGRRSGGYYG